MEKFFYESIRPARSLTVRQYIYRIGQYRYNWHKALEILLVMQGSLEMNFGGRAVRLEEDDFVLIDSNVGHASLARTENCFAMVMQLEPEYLEDYFGQVSDWKFGGYTDETIRRSTEATQIRSLLAYTMLSGESEEPSDRLSWEQKLLSLWQLLFTLFPPVRQTSEAGKRSKKQLDLMEKLLAYVEEHYRERLTLQELSQVCSYNSSYLSTYFKSHVGVNFYDYLTRIRVREATLELCSTDNTVLEIAGNHGFADVKAFHTAFRKTFGKSPMEYRRQILAENRGKELLEKRTFLPVTDEAANRKLMLYQMKADSPSGTDAALARILAEWSGKMKEELSDSCAQLDKLREAIQATMQRAQELNDVLH